MREIFNLTPKDKSTPSQLIADSKVFASPCDCEEDLLVNDCIAGLCAELDANNQIVYRLPYDVAGKRLQQRSGFNLSNGSKAYDRVSLETFTGTYFSELLPRVSDKVEEQRIGFTASILTGGTFTIKFDGQTTSNIPWNADANFVKNALELLSTIGLGNIKVVKLNDNQSTQEWKLFFQNQLAGINVPQTEINTDDIEFEGAKTNIQVTDRQGSKSHSMDTTYYDTDSNYIYPSGYASIGRKAPCVLEITLDGFSNDVNNKRCDDCHTLNGVYYGYASNNQFNKIQYFDRGPFDLLSQNEVDNFSVRNKSLFGLQNKYLNGHWKVKLCSNYNLLKYGCGLASRQTVDGDVGIDIALSYDVNELSNLNFSQYVGKSGLCSNYPFGFGSYDCAVLDAPKSGLADIYLNAFLTAMNPYSGCGYKTLVHYRKKVGSAVFIGYSGSVQDKGNIEKSLINYSGVIVNSDVNCQNWSNVELDFYKRKKVGLCPTVKYGTAPPFGQCPEKKVPCTDVYNQYGKYDSYHLSGVIDPQFIESEDNFPWCQLGTIKISSTNTSYFKSSTNAAWNSGLSYIQNSDSFMHLIFNKTNSVNNYINSYYNDLTIPGYKPSGTVDIYQFPNNFYVSISGVKNSGCSSCEVLNTNFILGNRNGNIWESTFSKFYDNKYRMCHHKKTRFIIPPPPPYIWNAHSNCYENNFSNLKFSIIPSGNPISGYNLYLDLENKYYQSIGGGYPYKIAGWNKFIDSKKLDPYTFLAEISGISLYLTSASHLNINAGASGICNFEGSVAKIYPYITSPVATDCTVPPEVYANYNDDKCIPPSYFIADIDLAFYSGLLYSTQGISCGPGSSIFCDTEFITGPFLLRNINNKDVKIIKDPFGTGLLKLNDKVSTYQWDLPAGYDCTPPRYPPCSGTDIQTNCILNYAPYKIVVTVTKDGCQKAAVTGNIYNGCNNKNIVFQSGVINYMTFPRNFAMGCNDTWRLDGINLAYDKCYIQDGSYTKYCYPDSANCGCSSEFFRNLNKCMKLTPVWE